MVLALQVLIEALCLLPCVASLWPMPRTFDAGNNTLQLSPDFSIHVTFNNPSQDLQNALSATNLRLKTDKFERLVVGRGKTDAKAIQGVPQLHTLELSLLSKNESSIASELALPLESRSESYELTVPSDGSPATLNANSSLGLFRGLTTFGQMWYSYNGEKYMLASPLEIRDEPAFVRSILFISLRISDFFQPYRGFSFDTARNL